VPHIGVGEEAGNPVEIWYQDQGSGSPVVVIHGYPFDSTSAAKQTAALLAAGHRVITYDRRGFGRSGRPRTGYDYDTLAADLAALLDRLAVDDCVLVGLSMGSGEVTRYLGSYGSARVRKAVLVGAVPPFLLRTEDNPAGFDRCAIDAARAVAIADPRGWFTCLLDDAYNVDVLGGARISEHTRQHDLAVALDAAPAAAAGCVGAWLTDFRADLARIDVPVLVMHGDEDRLLPIDATANRLPELIGDLRYEVIPRGPHHLAWTFPELVNRYLLEFVAT
jgi:non-heme chloroperoxidase